MRTIHIHVNLSHFVARGGRSALAETYAATPMAETNAREPADVAVNHSGLSDMTG